MLPATEAVNRPLPTKPAKAGSCPEPPPEMTATFDLEEASGRRKMILFSLSNARDGLVIVRELRAARTSLLGSEKKCFAVFVLVLFCL
jgi:hypothetical protein